MEYWNADLGKISLKHLEVYHLKVGAIYMTYEEIVGAVCERVARNLAGDVVRKRKSTISQARDGNRP